MFCCIGSGLSCNSPDNIVFVLEGNQTWVYTVSSVSHSVYSVRNSVKLLLFGLDRSKKEALISLKMVEITRVPFIEKGRVLNQL